MRVSIRAGVPFLCPIPLVLRTMVLVRIQRIAVRRNKEFKEPIPIGNLTTGLLSKILRIPASTVKVEDQLAFELLSC